MNRVLRITGFAACLLGIFLSVGGHWAVFQTVAWGRMIADFARTDSLGAALAKTFDGEHPCAMCLKIRAGRAQEKKSAPIIQWEKLPEFVLQPLSVSVALDSPPATPGAQHFLALHPRFADSPPKPPPRVV